MFGCQMWSYGQLDLRCENSTSWGLWGALYFHIFILFSALIMLNLVIGSICSSMGDAQEAYEMAEARAQNIKTVVNDTKRRGKEYGIKGISWKAIDAWSTGACTINRPCAQQHVGKSQSCMVISGRLIVHAPVLRARELESFRPLSALSLRLYHACACN